MFPFRKRPAPLELPPQRERAKCIAITLANGKTYDFAPMGATVEACCFRRLQRDPSVQDNETLIEAALPVVRQCLSVHNKPRVVEEAMLALSTSGPLADLARVIVAINGFRPAPVEASHAPEQG